MHKLITISLILIFTSINIAITAPSQETDADTYFVTREQLGTDWYPFKLDWKNQTAPEWDFSEYIEVPAGKYGFIRVEASHFVFEKSNKRLRLWGANLSGPVCFPTKEQAPLIASFLRRWGFNAIRFSHLDSLWANGLINYQDKSKLSFNEEKLDLFFFFISELKKNGIYYITDAFHDFEYSTEQFKYLNAAWRRNGARFLITFSNEMQKHHEQYVKKLFTSVNPYTGLSLANDPAFAGLQLLNESFLAKYLDLVKSIDDIPRELQEDFQAKWVIWAKNNELSDAYYSNNIDTSLRKQFLSWLERSYFRSQYKFLRAQIGLKCPITTTSCYVGAFTLPSAYEGDYSEGHAYYSHPARENVLMPDGKQTMIKIDNSPAYLKHNYQKMLPFLLSQRIGYQPYIVGEWNNCTPERFDAPLLMCTIGSIQDFDGAFLFNLAQTSWIEIPKKSYGATFVSLANPSIMINMIPAALAWHSSAIPNAQEAIAIKVPEYYIYGKPSQQNENGNSNFGKILDAEGKEVKNTSDTYNYSAFSENLFLFRLYNIPEVKDAKEIPDGMKQMNWNEKTANCFPEFKKKAATKSPLKANERLISVSSSTWLSVWGRFKNETVKLETLQVHSHTDQDFSVTVCSLDKLPIPKSRKLLISIGAISINQGTVFVERFNKSSSERIERWEKNDPAKLTIYKAVHASISFTDNSRWTCFSLDSSGVKDKLISKDAVIIALNSPNLFYLLER